MQCTLRRVPFQNNFFSITIQRSLGRCSWFVKTYFGRVYTQRIWYIKSQEAFIPWEYSFLCSLACRGIHFIKHAALAFGSCGPP